VLVEPGREWRANRFGGSIHVALNGRPFLEVDCASHVALQIVAENTTRIAVTPNSGAAQVILSLYGITEDGLRACEIEGAAAAPIFTEMGLLLTIPSRRRSIVQLWHGERSVDANPLSGNHAGE
jgi:hypothetical protein